jgi:hypothetical protein
VKYPLGVIRKCRVADASPALAFLYCIICFPFGHHSFASGESEPSHQPRRGIERLSSQIKVARPGLNVGYPAPSALSHLDELVAEAGEVVVTRRGTPPSQNFASPSAPPYPLTS